jgi:transposase
MMQITDMAEEMSHSLQKWSKERTRPFIRYFSENEKQRFTKSRFFYKYKNGESLAKSCRDLSGAVSYVTIRRWFKPITNTGSTNLSKPPDQIRTARTKEAIQKVKDRLKRKKPVSARTGVGRRSCHSQYERGQDRKTQLSPESHGLAWGVTPLIIFDERSVDHDRYSGGPTCGCRL